MLRDVRHVGGLAEVVGEGPCTEAREEYGKRRLEEDCKAEGEQRRLGDGEESLAGGFGASCCGAYLAAPLT